MKQPQEKLPKQTMRMHLKGIATTRLSVFIFRRSIVGRHFAITPPMVIWDSLLPMQCVMLPVVTHGYKVSLM